MTLEHEPQKNIPSRDDANRVALEAAGEAEEREAAREAERREREREQQERERREAIEEDAGWQRDFEDYLRRTERNN